MELDPEEMRVLGCLAEKQLTTPAQYPLTLNALTLACNQATSRDPVVSYDERTVEAAVTRAKTRGLARFFHPAHGRSALRFGHTLDEALGIDAPRLALVAVLMLRGPQTLAELRARTQRMAEFSDAKEVEAELEALARLDPPLVRRLGRQPGQKEDRYEQLLGPTLPGSALPSPLPASAPSPSEVAEAADHGGPSVDARGPIAELAAEVTGLAAEVAALRRDVDDLRSQLGV
ncbi:MAG TPA: YceH family protein [Acidimicrobiales bacterium]|nr:YceH family protein [Acidimicrobiales bacterium]